MVQYHQAKITISAARGACIAIGNLLTVAGNMIKGIEKELKVLDEINESLVYKAPTKPDNE